MPEAESGGGVRMPDVMDWYYRDFWSAPEVRALTGEERDVYRTLLELAWSLGGCLPCASRALQLLPFRDQVISDRVWNLFEEVPGSAGEAFTHRKITRLVRRYLHVRKAGRSGGIASGRSRREAKAQAKGQAKHEAQGQANAKPSLLPDEMHHPPPSDDDPGIDGAGPVRPEGGGGGGGLDLVDRMRTAWGFLEDEAVAVLERFDLQAADLDAWAALPAEILGRAANPKAYVRALIARYGRVASANFAAAKAAPPEPPSREALEDEARSRALRASAEAVRRESAAARAAAVPAPPDILSAYRRGRGGHFPAGSPAEATAGVGPPNASVGATSEVGEG